MKLKYPKLVVATAVVGISVVWWGCSEPDSLPQMRGASTDLQEGPLSKDRPSRLKSRLDESGRRQDVLEYRDSRSGLIETRALTTAERSFVQMAQVFGRFLDPKETKKSDRDFAHLLRTLGLKPVVARDQNTGFDDLAIIRTETSLPGIRYIHGQFDGEGGTQMQHLSFEIQRGPGAYQKALDLLQKSMSVGFKVPATDQRMTIFRRGEHVIWVKELAAEDLIHHPFNVYDQSDIGTIRVAVEKDPHAHEEP